MSSFFGKLLTRVVTVIIILAAAWLFYRVEIRGPDKTAEPPSVVLTKADRLAVVAEMAEDAETEEDMRLVFLAMTHMKQQLTAEMIFRSYRLLRAPSDEQKSPAPRDPEFVKKKGNSWAWWPGRDAAKARFARAEQVFDTMIGSSDQVMGLPPIAKCVTKVIRVWSWFGVSIEPAGTDENKMVAEMGLSWKSPGGTRFFCPK